MKSQIDISQIKIEIRKFLDIKGEIHLWKNYTT